MMRLVFFLVFASAHTSWLGAIGLLVLIIVSELTRDEDDEKEDKDEETAGGRGRGTEEWGTRRRMRMTRRHDE